MKYKLKEGAKLTKEDLIDTKWDFKLDENKSEFFQEYSFHLGIKWGSQGSTVVNLTYIEIFSHLNDELYNLWSGSKSGLKEMEFDDYFEEDLSKETKGRQLTHEEKEKMIKIVDEADNIPDKAWEDVVGKVEEYKKEQHKVFEEFPKMVQIDKGTFMWAVEQMKQGKKIRRNVSPIGTFATINTDVSKMVIKNNFTDFFLDDFEATDWEIYKEELKYSLTIGYSDGREKFANDLTIDDLMDFIKDI